MRAITKAGVSVGLTLGAALLAYSAATRINPNPYHSPGDLIDDLDGVGIYYNGGVNQSSGRHIAPDGYNFGIRYQCVEFVKRYYYEHFAHRMPDAFGNAADFFDRSLPDGTLNARRGLVQYVNGSATPPQKGDLIVFDRWALNPYGHVAIISRVDATDVEIAQQNPGPFGPSRLELPLTHENGQWKIGAARTLGWLRLAREVETIAPETGPAGGLIRR